MHLPSQSEDGYRQILSNLTGQKEVIGSRRVKFREIINKSIRFRILMKTCGIFHTIGCF